MIHLDRRHLLTGASGLVASAFLPAPAKTNDTLLSPAGMRSDIAILCDAYASLHPGLYRYLTPANFQRERQRLDRFAATPHMLGDFYLRCRRLPQAFGAVTALEADRPCCGDVAGKFWLKP